MTRRLATMSYLLWNRMRCLASFYQQHQFQLGKHQRLSQGAISQAVLDCSARLEAKWSLELNQAQLSNEYAEQNRERYISLRVGGEVEKRCSEAEMSSICFVKKHKHFVRHQMESEQRAFWGGFRIGLQEHPRLTQIRTCCAYSLGKNGWLTCRFDEARKIGQFHNIFMRQISKNAIRLLLKEIEQWSKDETIRRTCEE